MQRFVLKELPRYECLVEAAKQFPDLEPAACEAFMHVTRAGEEVMRVMNTHLAAHSITQGRFLVLMLLMDKGVDCPRPTTPGELADMASVSRATITGLLDTLERDALVRREPHPDDRRQMSIHLTPKAQTLMQEILPGHFRLINQLMGSLSDNERRTLVRLLAKVSAQAAAVAPGHAVPASEACPAGGTHS